MDLVTTRVFVPVLFLLWLVKSLAQKKIWIPNKAEMWLTLTFLFLSFWSLFAGLDAGGGLRKLLYLFTIFPVFFVAADIFQEEKWRARGIAAIISSGTIAAAVGLIQFSLPLFIGLGKTVKIWENAAPYLWGNSFGSLVAANSSWLVNIAGKTQMRAFGFFPDPHNFAFFVNLCLFAGLGYFFSQKKASKACTGVAVGLMLLAVGLSFSRGAYFGTIAGLLFFAIVYLKRAQALGKALAVSGVIIILIFIFNSGAISQRIASSFNLKEGSNAERLKNWGQAVEIIRDHPLTGVGLGNYSRVVDATVPDRSSIYAHNLFLDIAAETGILNAVVVLFLILISVWRNIKSREMLGLGLAAGLVGFLVHSVFDTALYSPQVLTILLVLIALGLTLNSKLKDQS
jgi:O-antigen ligase